MDEFLELSQNLALALLVVLLWAMLVGIIVLGAGVLMHAVGVFTCGTVYCL